MSLNGGVPVFQRGQRVRVHVDGLPAFATVRYPIPNEDTGGVDLILVDDDDRRYEVNLAPGDTETVRALVSDGQADSARVLAGLWTRWMDAAATNAESSAMASTPLKPYAHQTTAVYGAMGTAARFGDRFGHAACAAGVVMMVSNSTGVNLPSLS